MKKNHSPFIYILVHALTLPITTLNTLDAIGAPPTVAVDVENFPEVQTTETGSQPFTMTGLAEFEVGDSRKTVGTFLVPFGMVLILDGASADLQGATVADLMAEVLLRLTIPGEADSAVVATGLKTVTVDLGGTFTSTPVSWALPPMHLPPNTGVLVSVLQNSQTSGLDYRVLVTGHLVPAIQNE